MIKPYPNMHDLEEGCRFYPDEAFSDEDNANFCDTCDNKAEYMTCPEDYELYICKECLTKFGLTKYLDLEGERYGNIHSSRIL
jgi:hypothetical protein